VGAGKDDRVKERIVSKQCGNILSHEEIGSGTTALPSLNNRRPKQAGTLRHGDVRKKFLEFERIGTRRDGSERS